jgi:hypothetical protein
MPSFPGYDHERMFLSRIGFNERDINEILFAMIYADQFSHGTDGHNRLLIISKLAKALRVALNG